MLRRIPIAAALAALTACGDPEPATAWVDTAPNVLLLSIDTLRADHLGCYGYERPTSPEIDSLAETAILFENAQASTSWTLPSLASIFTSTYVSTHNCWSFGSRLDGSFTTLAEILTGAGYDSACVVSHLFCTVRHGLQQGFVHFDDTFAYPEIDPVDAVTSQLISERGVRFLEQKAAVGEQRPWLLWLHFFDPHDEYVEHPGISEQFVTPGERSTERRTLDLYDGEIAYTDQHVGRVLRTLETSGLAENTLVVLVADHGEEFGDHGGFRHGHTLFSELVRVPLIVRSPGIAPRRIPDLVRTVDVLPTLLDLIGLDPPADLAGRSLTPAMRGETLPDAPALAEIRSDAAAMESVLQGRYKLVRPLAPGSEPALYDLREDPRETKNVAAEHPELVAELVMQLRELVATARRLSEAYHVPEDLDLSESVLDQLRALGYVDGER